MARKVLMINLLLLASIVALGYHFVIAWEEFEASKNLARILAEAENAVGAPDLEPLVQTSFARPIPDYLAVSDRDLFRPERRPPAAEPEAQVEVQAPQFAKRPQMTGAVEVGNQRKAFLVVFDTPRSQGELRTVTLGDPVQGYMVEQITDTTVTLGWRDVKEVIDMFDSDSPPQQTRTTAQRTASLNIVRIGSRYAAVETSGPETTERTASGAQQRAGQQVVGNAPSRRFPAGERLGAMPSSRATVSAEAEAGPSGVVGMPRAPVPAAQPPAEGGPE